ncbi:MAG: Holliday junction branch migration DNA helicase RuvB [Planctomycetota bacterium]
MPIERVVSGNTQSPDEERINRALRPTSLNDYVGQPRLIEKLSITLEAVRQRGEPMEHVLLHGPPGLGKTTLAHIVATELGTNLTVTSGPAMGKASDLVGLLTKLQPRDVLFVDEIHRMQIAIEEYLYSAMEDFKIDVPIDTGMHAKTITLPLQPFTLIGATTRAGLVGGPMRSRFGITHNLEFYARNDLLRIVQRSAGLIGLTSEAALQRNADEPQSQTDAALAVIAERSRGTPRIANRLLRRVRDYAQVKAGGTLTVALVDEALRLEGVDDRGLDELDRRYLRAIGEVYQGGPVGLEAVAATLGEDAGTLEEMAEPYLLQLGLVARTRQGRRLTAAGAEAVGLTLAESDDNEDNSDLF